MPAVRAFCKTCFRAIFLIEYNQMLYFNGIFNALLLILLDIVTIIFYYLYIDYYM